MRVLFDRQKRQKLKPQDVTYNGQVIPSSVKFLGTAFDSALSFQSHFILSPLTTETTTYFRTKILVAGLCEDSQLPASFYIGNPEIVIIKKIQKNDIKTIIDHVTLKHGKKYKIDKK